MTLSHHRAVALALERMGDPAAAEPLAELLRKPKMGGYALTRMSADGVAEERTQSLREIMLARALFGCGGHEGVGKAILETYRNDLRGLFARHAAGCWGSRGPGPTGRIGKAGNGEALSRY